MNIDLRLGDCLEVMKTLPNCSIQCVVTSPPYFGLRDYGVSGQIGLEPTPQEYVNKLVSLFQEVKRVLKDDGVLWLNLGDSYAGNGQRDGSLEIDRSKRNSKRWGGGNLPAIDVKPKDLIGIPWRVAFALQADGWYLRQDIIWAKPNPMPESVTDRCTKAHEYIFLLTKNARYYYDADAVSEKSEFGFRGSSFMSPYDISTKTGLGKAERIDTGMRNLRSVWSITTKPFTEAHFATFPIEIPERCILAGSKPGDTILDPFNGAGTTGVASVNHQRNYIGIELNPEYLEMSRKRIEKSNQQMHLFAEAL
jgi:DNA modification methylase